jgi:hypothetical protein
MSLSEKMRPQHHTVVESVTAAGQFIEATVQDVKQNVIIVKHTFQEAFSRRNRKRKGASLSPQQQVLKKYVDLETIITKVYSKRDSIDPDDNHWLRRWEKERDQLYATIQRFPALKQQAQESTDQIHTNLKTTPTLSSGQLEALLNR